MITIFAILAITALLYLILKAKAPHDIYRQFALPAAQWAIVSCDLGKGHPRKRLGAFGVGGDPDAIFRSSRSGQIAVGEFKNRKYRGYVRRREYYQILMYIGLARETFNTTNVVGLLSFRDECIQVTFDEGIFRALIALRSEVPISLKNNKPLDPRPLHKRITVAPGNRKVRFPK